MAPQVDPDHVVPLVDVHLGEPAVAEVAGVVDQHVEVAERLDGGLHHPPAAVPVAHVVGAGHRLAARGPDLVDDGRRPVDVVDHHPGPLAGEEEGVLPAEAPAGARDHRHPAGQGAGGPGHSR